MTIAAACSIFILITVLSTGTIIQDVLWQWLSFDTLTIDFGVYVDKISAVMMCVVTIVSLMVHIYSIGYMAHDPSVPRFMSYLSIFSFFMLLLVMSGNMIQLFMGWEGVGLASYLLIGFWFEKESANVASMKAFITNRVGDTGLMLGMAAMALIFGSLSFPTIFERVALQSDTIFQILDVQFNGYTFMCTCLLVGAMAKSAQLGLHVWLPDAMEGPTPVSALIHAATMVTAGVFLLIRLSPLFDFVPIIKDFIVCLGAATALFAALVGLVQTDIKRVIAYSTCSQLGYMFMACGASAYSIALFHLVTHAFFKAVLFLGAGSVIHAMSGEQSMLKMGGLARKIPITYTFMWIGSLALAGIPFFAGFYSKDLIIESVAKWGTFPHVISLLVAGLTAFYSWRLIMMVFHGKSKASPEVQHHVHESSFVMLFPIAVLSIGAVCAGYFFMKPLKEFFGVEDEVHMGLPVIISLLGVGLAVIVYSFLDPLMDKLRKTHLKLLQWIQNGMSIDTLYSKCIPNFLFRVSEWLALWIEKYIIDNGGPNAASKFITWSSLQLKSLHTGQIVQYIVTFIVGVVLALGIWIVRLYV